MSGQIPALSSAEDLDVNTDRGSDDVTPFSEPDQRSATQRKRMLMTADAGALCFGMTAAFTAQFALRRVPSYIMIEHFALFLVSVPGFVIGTGINRLYQARANERLIDEVQNVVRAAGLGFTFMVAMAFAVQYKDLSRLWVMALAISTVGALLVERRIARSVFNRLRARGRMTRRIVIVGTDPHAIGLLHTYQRNPHLGYSVVGFVGSDDLGERGGVNVLGRIEDLAGVLAATDSVGVVVSLSAVESDDVNALTRRLTDAGYHVALSSSLRDIDVTRLRPQHIDGQTLIYVEPVIRGGWRSIAKRAFDMSLAGVLLLITSPLMLAAMVAIRIDSPGPVFFRQTRVGKDGREFNIIKLRTMTVDAEARKQELAALNEMDGGLFKVTHDPRITRVGSLLRKLSIDELPQLFLVMSGTMSMVGPRPALPDEVAQWDETVRERLRVLPGLTGMWQVSGRSGTSFEQYKRLDLSYVDNWSLAHDVEICLRTIRVVLTGRGAA